MNQIQDLQEIQIICKQWLNNADLCELTIRDGNIAILRFIVGGTDDMEHWIDIECHGIHLFNMAKDTDDLISNGVFVGEAHINNFEDKESVKAVLESAGWTWYEQLPKQAYQLEIKGAIEIKIICLELKFQERKEKLS